jgi:hypothetical protein
MLTPYKLELIRQAEAYNGKPYWSKPTDAKVVAGMPNIRSQGMIHIRVQESHEFEPHWCMVCQLT